MSVVSKVINIFTGASSEIGYSGPIAGSDLISPWKVYLSAKDFAELKIFRIMTKVLTDCYRFSTKLQSEQEEALFDTVVWKNAQYGLISVVAALIASQTKGYYVFDSGIIREATKDEQKKIDANYKKGLPNKDGVILDFEKFAIGRLMKHYFYQLHGVEQATSTTQGLAGSVQWKVKGYRAKIGVAETNSTSLQAQGKAVAQAAKAGKFVVIDGDDTLEQTDASKNVENATTDRERIYGEIASLLGCPVSYLIGVDDKSTGSGDSYERLDGRIEDFIHNMWIIIFQPVVKALLDADIKFVSQKWLMVKENLGSMAIIEGLNAIPEEYKATIIASMLKDIELNEKDPIYQKVLTALQTQPEEVTPNDNSTPTA